MVIVRGLGLFRKLHPMSMRRHFCSNSQGKSSNTKSQTRSTDEEAQRLADQAKMSQNLWDFMVPERNMGITHPFFLVLLVLTVSLHMYNNHRDKEEDERLRQNRLNKTSIEP